MGSAQPGAGVDIHVGMRLRLRRVQLRLEPGPLAEMLEVGEETLAAIEAGDHRMPPYLMARAASALDVPVSWFFDGLEHNTLAATDLDTLPPSARTTIATGLREQDRASLALAYFKALPEPLQVKALAILKALAAPDQRSG